MKQKATSWFYTLGLLFFVAGLALFSTQVASATDKNYTETYAVTSYRNFYLSQSIMSYDGSGYNCSGHQSAKPISTPKVTLGPASWHITGDVGSDTFTEDWSVNKWDQATNLDPNGKLIFNYNTEPSIPNSSASSVNSSGYIVPSGDVEFNSNYLFCYKKNLNSWNIVPTGQYGAALTKTNRTGLSSSELVGVHSWPTAWTITGTIKPQ